MNKARMESRQYRRVWVDNENRRTDAAIKISQESPAERSHEPEKQHWTAQENADRDGAMKRDQFLSP
jgi:hypothetical protein